MSLPYRRQYRVRIWDSLQNKLSWNRAGLPKREQFILLHWVGRRLR